MPSKDEKCKKTLGFQHVILRMSLKNVDSYRAASQSNDMYTQDLPVVLGLAFDPEFENENLEITTATRIGEISWQINRLRHAKETGGRRLGQWGTTNDDPESL